MRNYRELSAKDTHLSTTASFWFNHAASLTKVLIAIDEAISEEAKMNAQVRDAAPTNSTTEG